LLTLALAGTLPLLAACGGKKSATATRPAAQQPNAAPTPTQIPAETTSADTPTKTPAHAATKSATSAAPTDTPAPTDAPATATPDAGHILTADELQQFKPNELGQVPILEYHQIGPNPAQFERTPDQFRGDLQWLYDNNFQIVSLKAFRNNEIDIPAGKKAVVLSFDDSSAGQFRVSANADGSLAIDPDCAIGIIETFYGQHPDFGRGGVFAVLPQQLFDWSGETDESDQTQFRVDKLQWLVANGYELANHTYDHVDLSTLSDDEVMDELAKANDAIEQIAPGASVPTITLPYGMYPDGGDDTLLRGFDRNGKTYAWNCALEVGADPAVNPISNVFDPYAVARIQAFDDELTKWKGVFADNPGILYVSDGNPNTVTIPNELHAWLVDTLDESKLNGKQLIRY
jgi:peptidoglycan/xylan/chitin deacetylase (PgdA/CDA1 family)